MDKGFIMDIDYKVKNNKVEDPNGIYILHNNQIILMNIISELDKIPLSASIPFVEKEILQESDYKIINQITNNDFKSELNKNISEIKSKETKINKGPNNDAFISNREIIEINNEEEINFQTQGNEMKNKAILNNQIKNDDTKNKQGDSDNIDHQAANLDKLTFKKMQIIKDINPLIKFDDDNIRKSYSIINDDYLVIEEFNIDNEKTKFEFQKFFHTFDKRDLLELKKQIDKVNLVSTVNYKIGPVSTLDFLVETSYNSDNSRRNSIMENLISLEDLVFRWRKIGGDGNCYYRAVIFSYFESIIFERNIHLLQYLILDINRSFTVESYLIKKMTELSIKRDLVLKVLMLLYISLTLHSNEEEKEIPNDILKTYDLFLRSFNQCEHFDYGLVYYLRFKIFEYIKSNENKLYTKDFSVKIGNLLPVEYETEEGNFLWDKFYEDYLMKFFKDAEKIVIYITPFVLKVNIKVLIYDFGKKFVEKMKEFPCFLKPNNGMNPIILLYKGTHYDLIYEQQFFIKHTQYLTIFVNLDENLKIVTSKMFKEITELKAKYKKKEFEGKEHQDKNTNREPVDIKNKIREKNDFTSENYNINKFIDINLSKTEIFNSSADERINSTNEVEMIKFSNEHLQNFSSNQSKKENFPLINTNNNDKNPKNNCDTITDYNTNVIETTIKCILCKAEFKPNQQNIINLCKDCILCELKTNMLSKYIIFLNGSKLNFYQKKDSKVSIDFFKAVFYDTKVKIIDDFFELEFVFKLIEKEFSDFLKNEIKLNICSICEKGIDTQNSSMSSFLMPCGCSLCTQRCLKSYLDLIFNSNKNEKKPKKEYICICSTVYNINDMKKIFFYCNFNNIKTTKEIVINYFRERIFSQCMLCLQEKNNEGNFHYLVEKGNYSSRSNKGNTNNMMISAKLKDSEIQKILSVNFFYHLICPTCFEDQFLNGQVLENSKKVEKFHINKSVFCVICNEVHILITCKIVNGTKVSTNSDCKIV